MATGVDANQLLAFVEEFRMLTCIVCNKTFGFEHKESGKLICSGQGECNCLQKGLETVRGSATQSSACAQKVGLAKEDKASNFISFLRARAASSDPSLKIVKIPENHMASEEEVARMKRKLKKAMTRALQSDSEPEMDETDAPRVKDVEQVKVPENQVCTVRTLSEDVVRDSKKPQTDAVNIRAKLLRDADKERAKMTAQDEMEIPIHSELKSQPHGGAKDKQPEVPVASTSQPALHRFRQIAALGKCVDPLPPFPTMDANKVYTKAVLSPSLRNGASVHVVFAWDSRTFQVVASNDVEPLAAYQNSIANKMKNNLLKRFNGKLKKDDLVIAKYEGIYYRARVSAASARKYQIIFLDYGDKCNVNCEDDEIYELDDELMQAPIYGVMVILDDFSDKRVYPGYAVDSKMYEKEYILRSRVELSTTTSNVLPVKLYVKDTEETLAIAIRGYVDTSLYD